MPQNLIIRIAVIGVLVILGMGVFSNIIGFNNHMISLQEMKKSEIETTKVEYGQCITKILETNQVAKAYVNDLTMLASKAGTNLEQFNQSLMALVGTQVIPQLSPELRANVQREIISCRNAYVGRIDLALKPMFTDFNRLQRQFPNSLYNTLFFHWVPEELDMPKAEAGEKIFETGTIEPLKLD